VGVSGTGVSDADGFPLGGTPQAARAAVTPIIADNLRNFRREKYSFSGVISSIKGTTGLLIMFKSLLLKNTTTSVLIYHIGDEFT
jgi:hypothetical protein